MKSIMRMIDRSHEPGSHNSELHVFPLKRLIHLTHV